MLTKDVDTSKTKYFMYFAIAFVAVLMISNTVAGKLIMIGGYQFSGALFIFPLSFIFGDVLTEVYGYKASRKIIWSGFGAIILMSACYYMVQILPPSPFWANQEAYEKILGSTPRIVLASILAYFCGEFCNSYFVSKVKVIMKGKKLWFRTIGSTVVGQFVDGIVFIFIAFYGLLPVTTLFSIIMSGYIASVLYEILATPFVYKLASWLKKKEGIDAYDIGINYNPFNP